MTTPVAVRLRFRSPVQLAVAVLLFVASGCAAIMYELVWFQLLELYLGSSAISIGVLLGTFMGGMCAGSLVAPRLVGAARPPLLVYAALEAGIGALAIVMLWLIPLVGAVYMAWGGGGAAGIALRGLAAAFCLLPPTVAMGATLPVFARWVEEMPSRATWVGVLYAGNIAGGVAGCLVAGFYLLRVYDVATVTYVGAGLNGFAALTAVLLSRLASGQEASRTATRGVGRGPAADSSRERPAVGSGSPASTYVYLAIAVSGFSALAAQVIWTRLLALAFGATVYTFALVLAVFLIGLGSGSAAGSFVAHHVAHPHRALGWAQLAIVGALAWTAYILSGALPYWPVIPAIAPSIWYNFQLDFAHALVALFPGPVLWGASFPLALAALTSAEKDGTRLVGRVYAANTLGAVLGSVLASTVLIAWVGTQRSQQAVMILSAAAAVAMLAAPVVGGAAGRRKPTRSALVPAFHVAAIACLALALVSLVPALPGVLVGYGRNSASWVGHTGEILYVGEGLNSSIAVSRLPGGALTYHNAGKIQASSQPQDMRLQRMLGHLTTLIPEHPASILVIGCGSGVTAGAASIDPAVGRVTLVEIEKLVPEAASTYFSAHNFGVVRNPRVQIHIDDGRHYLLTTGERFDAITADPFDPWVRGAASLSTTEFFEAAKARLNPGGVMTVWVPLYTATTLSVKTQLATFFEVFPDGFVLGNTHQGKGYDVILVGQREFRPIDPGAIARRLQEPAYAPVVSSLSEVGIASIGDLLAAYAGRASDLKSWLAGAPINRDRNLRLQYLAGLGLNINRPEAIYQELLQYRQPPGNLFSGAR